MIRRSRLIVGLLAVLLAALVTGLSAQETNGRVKDMATTVRLREAPSLTSEIIAELAGGTPLNLIGRTANGQWYQATADGQTGWLAWGYVVALVPVETIPVIGGGQPTPPASTAPTQPTTTTSAAPSSGGAVVRPGISLRLRTDASLSASVIRELPGNTRLEIIAQSADGAWLNVNTPAGETGWVSAQYVIRSGGSAPVTTTTTGGDAPTTSASVGPAVNVRGVRAIYERGQALGNQRGVFTRVGDSISVSEYSLDAIGRGTYNLGAYGGLQRVIDAFRTPSFNSFTHVSVSAGGGWTTMIALEPRFRDPSVCKTEVSPLECEYDRVKPSVALIQLGTNDLLYITADQFSANINRIVDISIDRGVIPVLTTIPYRDGYRDGVDAFNAVIRQTAANRDVPLWDLNAALNGLPNSGVSGDGIHLSWPPGGYLDSANFASPEAVQSGYGTRNLTALQVLERVLNAMGG